MAALRRKGSTFGFNRRGGGGASPSDPYDSDPTEDDDEETSTTATLSATPNQTLGIATSTSESHGLTTTYDLPGTRTVPSSRQLSRYIISEHPLSAIAFSHVSVPKLRAAVFLNARVRNPSPTTLLRGPAGVSLDGTFLGNTTLARCAPGDTFELSLGVDESVTVGYRRPTRSIASQGMLLKEQVLTYDRSISLHNTRRNPIDVVVFDQVPISDDERLRIHVKKPAVPRNGNTVRGAAVGIVNVDSGAVLTDAKVEVRKGGEMRWGVTVPGGSKVKIGLEYEARLPPGEVIFGT
jgi:uncharacterized protein (TIGR02231 family)